MAERQLEVADGVRDPHLTDVDVARGAQRLRLRGVRTTRVGPAGPRVEPRQAGERHRELGRLTGLGRQPDRLGVVRLGPRPRRAGRGLIDAPRGRAPRAARRPRRAPRTSSTSARSRAPLVASRRYSGASSSHDSRRGSCVSSGSVSSSGTAARMSSAPPRPASVLAMPVAISPSARARGSRHRRLAARRADRPAPRPSARRRGSRSRARRRPARSPRRPAIAARSAATSRKSSASRSDPVRAAIDARSSISRTPSDPAAGAAGIPRPLIQQRERALAVARRPRGVGGAQQPRARARRRRESAAPTARTRPMRPSTRRARRRARRPRRADRRRRHRDARPPRTGATPDGPTSAGGRRVGGGAMRRAPLLHRRARSTPRRAGADAGTRRVRRAR